MKKFLALIFALFLVFTFVACEKDPEADDNASDTTNSDVTTDTCTDQLSLPPPQYVTDESGNVIDELTAAKPVIYLYPERVSDISVKLDFNGRLHCTYPEYDSESGWQVTAYPDGTLIDKATGFEYSYLFWDGFTDVEYDMSKGFVVKGEETAAFLRNTLSQMGLTPREYNEFIVYWLPLMQNNPYNLITVQKELYTENAKLTVTPEPDSLLRIFMVYKPLDELIEIEAPEILPFERNGFCVVEWGGAEIKE